MDGNPGVIAITTLRSCMVGVRKKEREKPKMTRKKMKSGRGPGRDKIGERLARAGLRKQN